VFENQSADKQEFEADLKAIARILEKPPKQNLFDIDTIKLTHADIVQEVKPTTTLQQIVAFHRGQLPEGTTVKDWFYTCILHFGIRYTTVQQLHSICHID
jgi:hypothetical protein